MSLAPPPVLSWPGVSAQFFLSRHPCPDVLDWFWAARDGLGLPLLPVLAVAGPLRSCGWRWGGGRESLEPKIYVLDCFHSVLGFGAHGGHSAQPCGLGPPWAGWRCCRGDAPSCPCRRRTRHSSCSCTGVHARCTWIRPWRWRLRALSTCERAWGCGWAVVGPVCLLLLEMGPGIPRSLGEDVGAAGGRLSRHRGPLQPWFSFPLQDALAGRHQQHDRPLRRPRPP